MMRIEEEIKLDFKGVLIRPKRSTLTSRSEVDLNREYVFHHSRRRLLGNDTVAKAWGLLALEQAP